MTTQQPEALRIADELVETFFDRTRHEAAGELRRLHSVNTAQQKELMEQARLLGISAERELVFRAEAETLQRGYAAARQEIDSLRAAHGQAPADAAPSAGAVAGPDDIDAIALTRYKVVHSHDSMFHRFAVVAGDGKQQLYLGRETECQNMARKFAGAFLDGAFYQSQIAAAPTPAVLTWTQPASKEPLHDNS